MKSRYLAMKHLSLIILCGAAAAAAADLPPSGLLEPTLIFRTGFDTNPVATSGTAASVLGDRDTLTHAVGSSLGYNWSAPTAAKPALKLTYATETVRYDRWSSEDYSTHRVGLGGQLTAGEWKFTGEGSSLFVDGSPSTHLSVATANANATALWRERRRQWQHRIKLQAQATRGSLLLRGTGTLLAYDYLTDVVPGRVPFADRSDVQTGLDAGWKRPQSLWFAGYRVGRQTQGIVPLPNSAFDYANNYQRLAFGWEGKLPAGTSLAVTAGPDFRHYTGAIDPKVFLGGRDRTSLWFETSLTAKPHPAWTVTGKATRFAWLSSTGKSAYFDSSAEFAVTWALRTDWSLRFNARVHRCDYYPTSRDDWESFVGAGLTRKVSSRIQVSAEALRHEAWNTLSSAPEREFRRLVLNVGVIIKL